MAKKSRQKSKYLENEKSFRLEIKSIFHHFKGFSVAKHCLRPESAPLMSVKNKSNLNFVIFINRKSLKEISSLKTKKSNKAFSKKEYIFLCFFKYMYRSWLFHSYYTYQLNSQSMGTP